MTFKIKLLVEGGLGGHMPHLYENGNLTFGELKDVFKSASKGKLTGTEKTDGQNIKLSFNVKTQQAVGARNKTQIKSGGLTIEQMSEFFASHPNPNLKLAFSDAVKIFEKAVKLLDIEQQIEFFGADSNIWYNAEVMDDRTRNVVNYDTRNLLIHRTGHAAYDRKTGGSLDDGDIDKKASRFMNFLEKVQNKVSEKRHSLLVNPIQNLKALDNKEALRVAFYKLDQTISKYNLSDSNTINDFLKAGIQDQLETFLPSEIKDIIINGVLNIVPIKKKELKQDLPKESKAEIDRLIEEAFKIKQTIIKPIEIIVTDFAAEMLKTLESIFILDNKKEAERLSQEVSVAIENIKSSDKQGDIEFLNRQLQKLKGADSISSAVEGFAFSYKGAIYKFTGKFAPVNQILGLFKYGRGSKKSDDEQDLQEVATSEKKYDTALLGGGFKPPHKGHIELIKQLASKAENVIIYTSDKSSSSRTFNSGKLKGKVIDGKKCNELLQKMIQEIPELNNVNIVITPVPLKEIFDYVEKKSHFAESILIGVGDKDEDSRRFEKISKYTPAEKKLKVDIMPLKAISFDGEPLSASRLREAISNENLQRVVSFIPNEIFNKTEFAQEMIDAFIGENKKTFKEEVFEEVLNIFNKESKLDEMSAMGTGAVAGHVATKGKKKMKISRKEFMEEMQLRKTIREALRLRQEKKNAQLNEEQQLRAIIKEVILEAKKDFNYGNTGLNVLAKHLINIVPNLISTYEALETKPEQRQSFQAHILSNIDDLLTRTESALSTGQQASGEVAGNEELEEEINLSIDEPADDKFLDVFGDKEKEAKKKAEAEPDFKVLPDADPTGVEFAQDAYKALASQTQEEYKKLRDPNDRKMFKDYLLSNIKSYLEQAEDKISGKADQVEMPQGTSNAGAEQQDSTEEQI